MRRLYTFLLYLLIPFFLFRLYWKARRLPAYRERISERFAVCKMPQADIFVHAVSLGEAVAAAPLIEALLAKHWRVLVTTMTPTGSKYVTSRFGQLVSHQYIPYDFPWALRRFFKKTNVRMGIIMETELWPNVIYTANRASVPLLLANARLSLPAFKQYLRMAFFFKPLLNQLTVIWAQSEDDAERFRALGASPDRIQMCGNIKFDISIPSARGVIPSAQIMEWGPSRTILIAASTHDNEEMQLLQCAKTLKTSIPNLLLLIVPRHPERFEAVYRLSQAAGFQTGLRSQPSSINADTEVVIIDSMGELLNFYRQSDYAFVGGSLVPIGGHNVLEPIALGVPVFCGPHMQNSKAVCDALCSADALIMVKNIDALAKAILALHTDPVRLEKQIANASAVLRANQGTVARYMEKIEAMLTATSG